MKPRIAWAFVGALTTALPLQAIAQSVPDTKSFQERQCVERGWHSYVFDAGGISRRVLWKGPTGQWTKGTIVVMHGGGGHHFQFCVANARVLEPQVQFSELALSKGFAVFLLESSDRVTDNEGRLCGKVWDDEVRDRPSLDLPFIGEVIRKVIPNMRPPGSRKDIFLTGLSSGGYMTTRAATHFASEISAFAPVSSGDPYGWHRVCEKGMTPRDTVHGAGFDNETGRQIIELGSCHSSSHVNERPWDGTEISEKPTFRLFHHRYDGVNDSSCAEKVATLLREHGYPEVPPFRLEDDRRRSLKNHLWQVEYSEPLLEFFVSHLRRGDGP